MNEPTHCLECGDEFHYDDTGGYSPPCPRCGYCLGCCRAGVQFSCHEWDDDEDDEGDFLDLGDGSNG